MVIAPPVIVPSTATLVTVPCGGVMHWLVIPLVVVVTFCATVTPEQVALPVRAIVELPIKVGIPTVVVYEDLSACQVSFT